MSEFRKNTDFSAELEIAGGKILFQGRPKIMGILNATPDSFSDGGVFSDCGRAFERCLEMLDEGADIIDIGGESTRPGAETVSTDEEIRRVIPLIERLYEYSSDIIISIDTSKSEVAEEAVNAGAKIINDISGLKNDKRISSLAAEYNTGLILMHMRGNPQTMQNAENLEYADLVKDIIDELNLSVEKAIESGVNEKSIVLDPGIGFSKTLEQNLEILGNISYFKKTGYPIMLGPSRKSFIGKILGKDEPSERVWGTAGVCSWLAGMNVEILRVHDVREIFELLKLYSECEERKCNV